jgi:hypothetical protein
MSDYDRNAVRWGQGSAQVRGAVDQGLRTFMIGVYNNMMVGLAITGVVAYVINQLAVAGAGEQAQAMMGHIPLTAFGVAIYGSPLRWIVMLLPLAFVMFFSFRINSMSASSARTLFFAFSAAMGLSLSSILLVYTGASVYRAFFITAAGHVLDDGRVRPDHRDARECGVRAFLELPARALGALGPDLLGTDRVGHPGDQGNVLGGRRPRGHDQEIGQRRVDALSRLHQHLPVAALSHGIAEQLSSRQDEFEKPRFAGAFLLAEDLPSNTPIPSH